MRSGAKKTNLVLIVGFVLVVIGGIGGMVPIGLRIQKIVSERDAAKAKNDELAQHIKDLETLDKQYKEVEKNVAQVTSTLPNDKSISELLNQVERMMNKSAGPHPISLGSIGLSGQPLDPKAKPVAASNKALAGAYQSGDYYELPLTINGTGDFVTALTVIDRVNSMSRLMAVTSVSMGFTQGGFNYTIGVTAFLKP